MERLHTWNDWSKRQLGKLREYMQVLARACTLLCIHTYTQSFCVLANGGKRRK